MDSENNQERAGQKETGPIRTIFGWIAYVAFVVLMTYLVITYVGQRTRVEGSSMETTLHNGDNLLVDKLSYRFHAPQRYDIVVFPYRWEKHVYYIKRIIGLPGETVQVKDGIVYIDGEPLAETYGNEPMQDGGIAAQPLTLGEDEYFLLGDNRNHSKDSRNELVGPVHRKELAGKAFVRIWPLDSIGLIRHK